MLETLADGWFSFAGGRRWRCRGSGYFCEVQDAGNCPSFASEPGALDRVRRIRSFYDGRLDLGPLDLNGTGVDILVANAMTESFGTVPSPLDLQTLERKLDSQPGIPLDIRLDQLIRDVGNDKATRWLVRREPKYINPIATPSQVSVGAHQMLLSTANGLASQRASSGSDADRVRTQVLRLAAESLHAARLATEYLNGKRALHQGQLPLVAATYNAGSPRSTEANPWHLVQYGEHIDRWIGYYNTSRRSTNQLQPVATPSTPPPPKPVQIARASGPSPDEHLSPHFSLTELTASDIARDKGISNAPSPFVVENLRRLAELLEEVRVLLGNRPVHINSGYRSPELNKAVGSSETSMHPFGLAVDFVCPSFGSPLQICRAIAASRLRFDQVIHEFGRWVHIGLGLPGAANRRQQLTIDGGGTHIGLLPILGAIAMAGRKTTS